MAYFKRRATSPSTGPWPTRSRSATATTARCSGPTWPNRLYLMTGQIDPTGANGGPIYGNYGARRRLLLADLPGDADRRPACPGRCTRRSTTTGFNVLEYFDQYQNASTIVSAVPERDEVLPARAVRVRRDARPAADRVVHPADLLPVRAPRLHARGGRRLRGEQGQRDRGQPRRLGQDRLHPHLRRERRLLRSRAAADRPGGHARRVHHRVGKAEGRAGPDRPRLPRALHHRLAVDGRRLRLPRHVRPHLGHPAPSSRSPASSTPTSPPGGGRPSGDFTTRARAPRRSAGSRGCRSTKAAARAGREASVTSSSCRPYPGANQTPPGPAARAPNRCARRAATSGQDHRERDRHEPGASPVPAPPSPAAGACRRRRRRSPLCG